MIIRSAFPIRKRQNRGTAQICLNCYRMDIKMKKKNTKWMGLSALPGILAGLLLLWTFWNCTAKAAADPTLSALEDGAYTIEVELSGGTGRAAITSPAELTVKEGTAYARIEWSSASYDYMMVGGEKYLPCNEEGNSVFEIPVLVLDEEMAVTADTTAMSTPHEIEYALLFHGSSIASRNQTSPGRKAALALIGAAVVAAAAAFGIHKKKLPALCLCALIALSAASCASLPEEAGTADISEQLNYSHSMELRYAKEFAVDYYEEGFALITIENQDRYLVIPEGREAPADLEEGIIPLQQPMENIYLAASAAMDMFAALDAMDSIRFSALKPEGWYVEAARKAMEAGDILYAGKYSAPDYERIVSEGCSLAIENTMIYHTPEVKEQLEKFHIPVLVDYSSYEENPLGRMEWVKLYGLLAGKEEAADRALAAELEAFASVGEGEKTGKTVAFFYITANGEANVRKSSDYLPKMIELAGGSYIFDDLGKGDSAASSTVTMQMEEFYAAAKDADYIIYNSTVDGELASAEELLLKSSLLENFKAVQEGNVFCTTKNLYQSSMELGTIISDIHKMLTGEEDSMTFLYQLR